MLARVGLKGLAPTVTIAPVRPVSAAELALYEDVWTSIDTYGHHSPGEARVAMFGAMSGASSGSVLDAGCGSGKGSIALQAAGFDPTLADMTDAGLVDEARRFTFVRGCLWHPIAAPQSYDYVYCCDVLEHIPTEYTMLTVARLIDIAREGVFLSIALVPDQFGVWVGKHLHQTVQPFTWWRDRLAELGSVVEGRDLIDSGVFYVRPRQ
jgi:SAM-dependent methyltransferase